MILARIEQAIGAPLDKTKTATGGIQSVTIYKADRAGNPVAGVQTVYDRSGSTACAGFTPNPMPYTLGINGYPMGEAPAGGRCDILSGCTATIPMDSIGVTIVYRYYLHTPRAEPRQLPARREWRLPGLQLVERHAHGADPVSRRRRPANRLAMGSRAWLQGGQGLVEFATMVPVFLLILLGMLEFGFAFNHHLTLEVATREGARAGAAMADGSQIDTSCGGTQITAANVDPLTIAAVERVLKSPGSMVDMAQISSVQIYKVSNNGSVTGPGNVWTYRPGNAGNPAVPCQSPAQSSTSTSLPMAGTRRPRTDRTARRLLRSA